MTSEPIPPLSRPVPGRHCAPFTIEFRPPRRKRFARLRYWIDTAWAHLFLTFLVVWIFGGSLFFLMRFSVRFYSANEHAIHSFWRSVFH